ncbi:MAG: hypothetical protein HPY71_01545 [Firmicutes bacterium]|nr:hypothetical protein [Bacillota bacterium]
MNREPDDSIADGFWKLAHKYGLGRLLWCSESWLAILAALMVYIFALQDVIAVNAIRMREFSGQMLTASATLFGVLIAGFSITVSMLDSKLLAVMWRSGVMQKLVFPFWWVSAFWIVSLIIQGITWLVSSNGTSSSVLLVMFVLEIGITSYALFGTLWAIGAILRFTFAKAALSLRLDQDQGDPSEHDR